MVCLSLSSSLSFVISVVVIVVIVVVASSSSCRRVHRGGLLTGSRGRLTILAVVTEEVDVVTYVGRPKIRDLDVRLPDGLRPAGDILDAGQVTEAASVGHLVPAQIVDLSFRVVAAGEQPANVVVAAHTLRHDLLDEVAEKREQDGR